MIITNQSLLQWGIPLEIGKNYNEYLNRHIDAVQTAGRVLAVPSEQLEIHDASKWTQAEFYGYAMHFYGGGAPDAFASAWLHHIHHNPHHWEHWIFPTPYTLKGADIEENCIQMPNNYVLEMVADWQGAGFAIHGSWDISEWLTKNLGKIRLHHQSKQYLMEILQNDGLLK